VRNRSQIWATKRRIYGDLFEQYLSISSELNDRLIAQRRPLNDIREQVAAGIQVNRSLYPPLSYALRLAWGCAKAEASLTADAYIAHDDVALIAADYMTATHGGILIYDAIEPFEYEHKTWGYNAAIPREAAAYYTLLSRPALLGARTRFATSQPLADFMEERYGVPFVTLPNYLSAPSRSPPAPRIREDCGCSESDFLLLYINSIYPASRFNEVLLALSRCEESYHIVNLGDIRPQSLKNELDGLISQLGLASRVHFFPAAPYEHYIGYISACDAALVWLDDINVNCVTNLHNRYIDAIAAGLPLLSSRNAAFALLIEEYDLGLIVPDRDPETLARHIAMLRERRDGFLPSLYRARSALRWDTVEGRLAGAVSGCRSATFITTKNPTRNQRIQRQVHTLQKQGIQVSGIGSFAADMTDGSDIGTWVSIPDDFELADANAADPRLLDC
jgi:glycosyltransferase involved in cell wall biosynthesis